MHKIKLPFTPLSPSAIVIDLEAVAHNYKALQDKVGPNTKCAAVVKADAYGLGMSMVSTTLQDMGCRKFFVASIDEGIDLRSILGDGPAIYVLSGLRANEEEEYLSHDLIPVLSDLSQVQRWNGYAKIKGFPLPAILHMDTGMMRTGLKPDETAQLGLNHVSDLELKYVMSHLACAYEPHNPMNQQQLETFDNWRRSYPIAPASLANSGGIFLGERYHMDMVRPGLALYGGSLPRLAEPGLFKPAVKVYAQVLQTGHIQPGQSVGYDGTFTANRPTRIATLGIGYADGYLRSLSNRGSVYLCGHKIPVIGRVSMDLITVDITDVPEGACVPGDWAEVIGEQILLDDVARAAETAPWELLTSLSTRSHRFYQPNSLASTERRVS